MKNVQQRLIFASAATVGASIDTAASAADNIWPSAEWPPLRLADGLRVGSVGGHGPIRYHVAEFEPGRRVRFAFDPSIGLVGYHELSITDQGKGRSLLTHTIDGRLRGRMRLLWPLAVRWLHEALLQDLLDNAELAATGTLRAPRARWSLWVRMLRSVKRSRSEQRYRPAAGTAR